MNYKSSHTCRVCNRELKNPDSILEGIGAICKKKQGITTKSSGQLNFFMNNQLDEIIKGSDFDRMNFDYSVPFNSYKAQCQTTILKDGDGAIVILTELPDNPGASITNSVEHIAKQLQEKELQGINEVTWVEHYTDPDRFSIVTFNGNGKASWKHLSEDDLKKIIQSFQK